MKRLCHYFLLSYLIKTMGETINHYHLKIANHGKIKTFLILIVEPHFEPIVLLEVSLRLEI